MPVSSFLLHLVADTQLCNRLCQYVVPLVRWSVMLQSKTRINDNAVGIECVCVGRWGLSEAEGWKPLSTRPKQY